MKRKIFSKLLMGALLVASVSSFVSCKDYDDDINNLQDQINAAALKSDLSALQTTLASVQTTASSAASTAQSALEKAGVNATDIAAIKATATAQGDKIADAAAQAAKGVTDAAAAQAAANAAQSTADAAKADAATAKAAAEAAQAAATAAKADADAAIAKAIADLKLDEKLAAKADAADLAALTTKVNGLATDLAKAQTDLTAAKALADANAAAITALETKAADFESRIAALEAKGSSQGTVEAMEWAKAVTSVELVPAAGIVPGWTNQLLFLTGTEINDKFGASVSPAGNVVRTYGAADKGSIAPVDYTLGKEISFNNRIILRVNPSNAVVNKEDITLINSLGESLDEFVEVKDIEDYNQLITRADVATGLKLVTIARKAGVTDDQLAEATTGVKIKAADRPAQRKGDAGYAIGIKTGDEGRVLYTTFDLDVWYGDYIPLRTLNFYVKGDAEGQDWEAIANLRNRWNNAQGKLIGEDETKEVPVAAKWYAELNWANLTDDGIKAADRYTVDTLSAGTKKNYAAGDGRQGAAFDYVVVDEATRSFTVNTNPLIGGVPMIAGNSHMQYYYVVLDKFAAVESAPSEWEAWSGYKYTGLNTITPATEPLKITVDSESAIGDIIGFRVIACNYDGSLIDPDGRSFYVQVGTPAAAPAGTVTVAVTARTANNAVAANYATIYADYDAVLPTYNAGIAPFTLPDDFVTNATFPTSTLAGTAFTITTTNQTTKVSNTVNGKYYLLQDDKGLKAATSWSNLKFIAVDLQQIERIVDGQTVATSISFNGTDPDHHNKVVNKVTVAVTKNMPAGPANFSWKSGAPISGSTLDLYLTPSATIGGAATWNAAANYGWVDLSTYCNNLNAQYRFRLADANALNDGAYERTVDGAAATTTTGKSVYVMSAATGEANDAAGFLLGVQGPADAAMIAASKDTYVTGAKTSALKVQYTYATAISLKRNSANTAFVGPTAPTVDIPSTVSQVRFTYAYADNTYRAVKYQSAKTWAAPTATPTVFAAGTWNSASDQYVLLYDGTDMGGIALQPSVVAPLLPATNTAPAPVAYRWDAADAAIAAPANAWTDQVTYEAAGDRQAIIPAAGSAVTAYTAGYASLINLSKFVIVNNDKYEASNDIPFNAANMMVGTPTITFKSNSNQVNNEYYDATLNWAVTVLQFAPKAPAVAIPTVPVAATVEIKGKDAFDQDQIITLPFTIIK